MCVCVSAIACMCVTKHTWTKFNTNITLVKNLYYITLLICDYIYDRSC